MSNTKRETIIGLSASVIAVTQQIASNILTERLGSFWATVLTSAAAIFLILGLTYTLLHLRDVKWYRRGRTKTGKFEGFYFSTVSDDEAPYSISKIYYSSTNRFWVHHGYALDKSGNCVKEWRVTSNYFDPRDSEWYFNGKWWVLKNNSDGVPEKCEESDQISIIIMPKEADQRPQSLFFDDPRKSARSGSTISLLARTGRATMHYVNPEKLRTLVEDQSIKDIEDVVGKPARLLVKEKDRLFRT